MIKVVCLSDTHCRIRKIEVPDGDILLHAGDLTFRGDIQEISQELRAISKLPHKTKLLVPGNHDMMAERNPTLFREMCLEHGIVPLIHDSVTVSGYKIFGSGSTPEFFNWALMYNRAHGKAIWATIPDDTEILITHGPPMGMLDVVMRHNGIQKEHVGCFDLAERIANLKNLSHHIFGHIHSGYGTFKSHPVTYINASNCDDNYRPLNKPIIFFLNDK